MLVKEYKISVPDKTKMLAWQVSEYYTKLNKTIEDKKVEMKLCDDKKKKNILLEEVLVLQLHYVQFIK